MNPRANSSAEIDALPTTPVIARTYSWGLGGYVGGLLMANISDGTISKMVYYGYDGSGNVNSLVDTTDNLVGFYDYNNFGEITDRKLLFWGCCGRRGANLVEQSYRLYFWSKLHRPFNTKLVSKHCKIGTPGTVCDGHFHCPACRKANE